jgi:ATP-dependent Lon protease
MSNRISDRDSQIPPRDTLRGPNAGSRKRSYGDSSRCNEDMCNDDDSEDHMMDDADVVMSLRNVRRELMKSEPDLVKYLKTPMRLEDRTKLVQLFEIYKFCEPNTRDWLEMRDQLNKTYRDAIVGYQQYSCYSEAEQKEMEEDIARFSHKDSHLTLKYEILDLETSDETKATIYNRFEEFTEMSTHHEEYGKMKNWLNWATAIPHNKLKILEYKNLTLFLKQTRAMLDAELYGMEKVKEQLLLFLNAKLLNPKMQKCHLALVGQPGVGKTAITSLLATVLDFPLERIQLGGASRADFFKGHAYTYVGAAPGIIVRSLKRLGCKNGIIAFDEYNRIANDPEMAAALLHITDFSQNQSWEDDFLAFPMDLSHLWFIYTMNALPDDPALKDRLYTIEVTGYTKNEKREITENYLLRKACMNAGLKGNNIRFGTNVSVFLVEEISNDDETGVRSLEQAIGDMVSKILFLVEHQNSKGVVQGIPVSFNPGKKLSYPVTITKDLAKKLLEIS